MVKQAIAMAPSPKPPKTPELAPWEGEPADMNSLINKYHVEAKVPGRTAGTTLFLVQAVNRDGKKETRPVITDN
jgi:hypothetical protein